ncbi:hypothetical protein [uncultured Flavobacterium sp.]|uniref:hypothetical protein n=1 Tax=uncultured Flavobacterium sp. TaxID=165435 RepID=UPI002611EB01|nr:hypothetical protein [uncultured Flavobacterium sp.]
MQNDFINQVANSSDIDNPRLREAVYVHIEHLIGEKSFANDIAFIEIGQLEGDDENQIELYNLKSYIDIEMKS